MSTGSSTTQVTEDLGAEVDLTPRAGRVDLHDPGQRAEIERAICNIPGVVGARLVPGFERQVDEFHVLTTLDKQPKQAVRDVQTVLMARFGVPSDHRVVSVVQLDERHGLPDASRVVIERVAITQSGLTATVEVVLRNGEAELRGVGEASSSASGRYRATAAATLDAVRPLIGEGCLVELEGVDMASVLSRRLAVAMVHFRTERTELTLCGSALVRDGEPEAVARAVLDALNRTIVDSDRG